MGRAEMSHEPSMLVHRESFLPLYYSMSNDTRAVTYIVPPYKAASHKISVGIGRHFQGEIR